MSVRPAPLPLIGVTTSEVREAETIAQTPEGDPPRKEMALGLTYLQAIEAAGGLPVVIPPLAPDAVEATLDRLDAVCLSGGPDIDPRTYGEGEHPELGPTEPDLDLAELVVARSADARALPILAICRGAQVLNIARGGSLHQHVPELNDSIGHRQPNPGEEPTHPVRVDPASKLGEVLGSDRVEVNSFHHQAVARLGEGLRAVAWAEDGLVEAVEDPERDFLIGVQWHAETLGHFPEGAALFRRFVESADPAAAAERQGSESLR
ncbi:MAG: gamma-glutamyl-gamma-aminobutyrate hydrolase family protein [Solirubrobacterales bacterium]